MEKIKNNDNFTRGYYKKGSEYIPVNKKNLQASFSL